MTVIQLGWQALLSPLWWGHIPPFLREPVGYGGLRLAFLAGSRCLRRCGAAAVRLQCVCSAFAVPLGKASAQLLHSDKRLWELVFTRWTWAHDSWAHLWRASVLMDLWE